MNSRILGAIGMLAAIVPLAGTFTAVSMSPWFTWTGSWLSDLGRKGLAALAFNSGLILGGILATMLSYSIYTMKFYDSRVGLIFFMAAAISLVFIGIFPVYTDMLHTAPSVVFFLSSTAALLLIGNSYRHEKRAGWLILGMGVLSLAALPMYFVPRPLGTNAVAEMVTSLGMFVFVLLTAVSMLRS